MCKDKEDLIYRSVDLNSKHRSKGTNQAPRWFFRPKDGMDNVEYIRVKNLQIPYTWSNLPYDTLRTTTKTGTYTSATLRIVSPTANIDINLNTGYDSSGPDASPYLNSIATQLATQCNAADSVVWTWAWDDVLDVFKFGYNGNGSITFNDYTNHASYPGMYSNLWEKLGGGSDQETWVVAVTASLSANNLFRYSPSSSDRVIQLLSKKLSRNNWRSVLPDDKKMYNPPNPEKQIGKFIEKSSVIAKIPIINRHTKPNGAVDVIHYDTTLEEKYNVKIPYLHEIDLSLEDMHGFPLDIGPEAPWTVTLEFWTKKKRAKMKGTFD